LLKLPKKFSNAIFETLNHAFRPNVFPSSRGILKRFMWCSFMFPIWVLKIPQHVSKSNNKEQYNGLFKPKDNTIDNKQIIITIQSLANLLTNK